MMEGSGNEVHFFYRSGCYYERPGDCCPVCFSRMVLAVLMR